MIGELGLKYDTKRKNAEDAMRRLKEGILANIEAMKQLEAKYGIPSEPAFHEVRSAMLTIAWQMKCRKVISNKLQMRNF